MPNYRVELSRKESDTKNLYVPVRTFKFEATDDATAITHAKRLELVPFADANDRAFLFDQSNKVLWSEDIDA